MLHQNECVILQKTKFQRINSELLKVENILFTIYLHSPRMPILVKFKCFTFPKSGKTCHKSEQLIFKLIRDIESLGSICELYELILNSYQKDKKFCEFCFNFNNLYHLSFMF